MADVTVADVLTSCMSMLGDPAGEITQEIFDDYTVAYSEAMALLLEIGAPEIERECYFTLGTATNTLFPSLLGVTDFAEPRQIFERGGVNTSTITSVVDGTPITVTVSGGVPSTSDGRVELWGIPGVPPWLNRDWFITTTGVPGEFTLNGSIATGIGGTIAAAGNVSSSIEGWNEVQLIDANPAFDSEVPLGMLTSYRWDGRVLYFPNVANEPRQLWIQYTADFTPPPTGVIGMVDGREKTFLAQATGAHFAPKRQLPMGPQLAAWAYGESGQADGTGGSLRALILPLIKQKNGLPRRSGKFRIRRGMVVIV